MSAQDRLRETVAAVQLRLKYIRIEGLAKEHAPLLEVSAALVRGTHQHCHSVLALAEANSWAGMATVERAAWEMWNELDYLLRSDDPPYTAVKVQANAVFDVIDLLQKTPNAPSGMLQRNEEFRDRLEAEHSNAVAEVRKQRKDRKWHWSGISRTAVVGPDDASRQVYKLLSWESHPDIASLRYIDVVFEGDHALVRFGDEGNGVASDRSSRSATELLLRSWNLFAQFWGLEPITGIAGWSQDA